MIAVSLGPLIAPCHLDGKAYTLKFLRVILAVDYLNNWCKCISMY